MLTEAINGEIKVKDPTGAHKDATVKVAKLALYLNLPYLKLSFYKTAKGGTYADPYTAEGVAKILEEKSADYKEIAFLASPQEFVTITSGSGIECVGEITGTGQKYLTYTNLCNAASRASRLNEFAVVQITLCNENGADLVALAAYQGGTQVPASRFKHDKLPTFVYDNGGGKNSLENLYAAFRKEVKTLIKHKVVGSDVATADDTPTQNADEEQANPDEEQNPQGDTGDNQEASQQTQKVAYKITVQKAKGVPAETSFSELSVTLETHSTSEDGDTRTELRKTIDLKALNSSEQTEVTWALPVGEYKIIKVSGTPAGLTLTGNKVLSAQTETTLTFKVKTNPIRVTASEDLKNACSGKNFKVSWIRNGVAEATVEALSFDATEKLLAKYFKQKVTDLKAISEDSSITLIVNEKGNIVKK